MPEHATGEPTEVRVERTVYPDTDPRPAVALWIANGRSEPVVVRVTDHLPDGATTAAVEFAGFERDRWRVSGDGDVVYRRSLAPQETVLAMYYVRSDTVVADEQQDPTVEVEAAVTATDESATASPDGGERLLPDGGRIEGPWLEKEQEGDDGDDSEGRLSGTAIYDSEFDDPEAAFDELLEAHQPISRGEVARTMLAELRAGSLDEELVAALRSELGGEDGERATAAERESASSDVGGSSEVPATVQVRLDRLHSKVETLASYSEALEEFLDEHGTGQQAIDRLTRRMDTVEEELGAITGSVGDLQSEMTADTDRLDDIETVVTDLREDLAALESRVADQDGSDVDPWTIESIERRLERLDGLDDRVDEIEASTVSGDAIEELAAKLETVDERTATLEDALETVTDRMDDLEEQFEGADAGADEQDLEALAATVDANETAIEDMRSTVDEIDATFNRLTQAATQTLDQAADEQSSKD